MNDLIKYVFDRTAAFVGLIILMPIMIIIGIMIYKKMPGGPCIFKQKRVGKNGKLFTMYKFRSMIVDHNGSTVSVLGDRRITEFGHKLRRNKIDEIPELWNILIGEMSFVGPRPDVPGYADALTGDDREMLRLRPGITGPATLKYRNEELLLSRQKDPKKYNDEVIWPDKVRINRYYLHNHNVISDIKIMLCTILKRKMIYNNEVI